MRTTLITLVFVLLTASAWAQSKDDANAILKKVDDIASSSADFTAKIQLETTDTDGKKTNRTLTVWQKGKQKRMLKVSAPPRLKNVGLMATDKDQLYLYLPSFGRVRRVAGQKRGEPFLGSNFTQDDMVRTGYAERYKAKLIGQDEKTWTLHLDPKKPDDDPYHHLTLKVQKPDHVVAQVDYFGDSNTPIRRLLATDIKVIGKTPLAHRIEAHDLRDKSHSVAILSEVKTDTGIKDSFFSERYLKRK